MPTSIEAKGTRLVRRAPFRAGAVVAAALSPVALVPGAHTSKPHSGHEITLKNSDQAPSSAKQIMLGSNVVALTSFVAPKSQATVDSEPQPASRPGTYTVREGNSPWSIAEEFAPNQKDVVAFLYMFLRDNRKEINPAWATIYPGEVFKIPAANEPPAPAVPLAPPQPAAAAGPSTTNSHSGSYQNTHQSYHASYSAPAPAPQTYAGNASSGFEACVIQRESGGDPNARNGQYWGIYQFGPTAWAEAGGNPADFGNASAAEQQQVFHQAMAKGMEGAWAPDDGC